MLRFLRLLRLALWRALEHDAFATAKAAAYSSILTLFPALMLVASALAAFHKTESFLLEISYALGRILPPGTSTTALAYFSEKNQRPIGVLITAGLITLWTASGVMVSWMEGFRLAYQLPRRWGLVKERFIAFGLVILAGIPLTGATLLVAFGNQIEAWMAYRMIHELSAYIGMFWTMLRWLIAIITGIVMMALIYHYATPRTHPWHTVLPGSVLATCIWFPATMGFGYYVGRYSDYSLIYGSIGTAIALLVWMYIVSIIVLLGAEFNALLFPRVVLSQQAVQQDHPEHVRAG